MRGDSVDLSGVENRVDAVDEPVVARITRVLPEGLARSGLCIGKLPEFDLCAFLAAADLPAVFLRLTVCKPAWVSLLKLKVSAVSLLRPCPTLY
jgi:hypothetical protein